ncbi:bifunctional metallophosphatase/5'-nucleotidase [Pseudidiomarina woesei]|uniref:2',3'-cyclic-nucleotide 2'-phosphodiesterase/5'-or 3'-nucleotidase, 5'-nucleotidase family n=1 Tax=Pseudidiomarina woesei TaxID=1381080 RepID=A0A0K6H1Q4_9GAMM|nr:5'-nucleotidase C-terminal domain-containing protein [Pseudidiomarina woesei]CUA84820.1 2',3'-cyclic-nucleotide 2'-phosphodiesterase/5'-or 3'-nucleotidase, 5'-nucleotidase family [Pseudidiomarina woesei]
MKRLLVSLVSCAALVSCAQLSTPQPYTLTVAHINDHHSHLLPISGTSVRIQGEELKIETGGFARVATQIETIRKNKPNVLTLHAGDAITGTLFYTLFDGAADAALMNQVCFDAFELGNHEFDSGDAGLKRFLDALSLSDCGTVVLGANVEPEIGVSPLTPKTRWDSFKPYAIYDVGGERIGVIGIDIAVKTKNSSQPDKTTEFADEYTTAKYYIDELRQLGIEKIGLLTHIQYENDLALAEKLPAVDFIIGGDSHTLLGDYARYGLPAVGPYPMTVNNADGDQVCVAHAWQYSQVVGELAVTFEGDVVANCGGQSHFLIAEDAPAALANLPQFAAVSEHPQLKQELTNYQTKIDELTQQQIAQVEQRLCMRRMGPQTTEDCGVGRHSDAHAVVAQAFLASTPQADFALQNGGGVRREIAAGTLTVADVYSLLPFSNTLVEMQITGAEVKQVLEQALAYATSAGGSDGAYPHGAGIRFAVDMTAAEGQRVSELEVWSDNSWQALQPAQTYIMVTNSFLAAGNDGWALLGDITAAGRSTDTYVNYAQSFVDWARKTKTIKRPDTHSTKRYKSAAQ